MNAPSVAVSSGQGSSDLNGINGTPVRGSGSGEVYKMKPQQQNEHFEQIKLADERQQKRRKRKSGIFKDSNLLTDAERDELHIEMYRYMTWLKGKIDLVEDEKKHTTVAVKNEASG